MNVLKLLVVLLHLFLGDGLRVDEIIVARLEVFQGDLLWIAEAGLHRRGIGVLFLVLVEECLQRAFIGLGHPANELRHRNRRDLDRCPTVQPLIIIPSFGRRAAFDALAEELAKIHRQQLRPKRGKKLGLRNPQTAEYFIELVRCHPITGNLLQKSVDLGVGNIEPHFRRHLGSQPGVDYRLFRGGSDVAFQIHSHEARIGTGDRDGPLQKIQDHLPLPYHAVKPLLINVAEPLGLNDQGILDLAAPHVLQDDRQEDEGDHGQQPERGDQHLLVFSEDCKRAGHGWLYSSGGSQTRLDKPGNRALALLHWLAYY